MLSVPLSRYWVNGKNGMGTDRRDDLTDLIAEARTGGAGAQHPLRRPRVPLDEALAVLEGEGLDVIALHEALDLLARSHPRPAQVVTLRFFGGLSVPEVAESLEVSATTVESDWRFARAWLRGQLGG